MQTSSTTRCTPQRSLCRRLPSVATRANAHQGNRPVRLQQQQHKGPDSDSPATAIPAPQEMQASVMLVPKESSAQALLKQASSSSASPLNSFLVKCRLAWNLFFPTAESSATRQLSPKELGKQRLSMILVADRCGLSPNSLVEMKKSTLAALQDCMDLEDLQDAHLRFTMTRENGVTYSMAVPILRPDADEDAADADAAEGSWEDEYEEFEETVLEAAEGFSSTVDALDQSAAAAAQQHSSAPPLEAAATVAAAGPHGWGAAGTDGAAPAAPGSRAASRTGARRGSSRGSSPAAVEVPLDGTAVMTPDMLKELLVEELVHDVEELVEHMGPAAAVRAVEAGDGVLLIEPAAAGAGEAAAEAAAVAADVLAGQLEAAVAEVQHFGSEAAVKGEEAAEQQGGEALGQQQ